MRVISGTARGRRLKKVPGDSTRPIMDRVKESLFNILGSDVLDTRWLDMFAGTGQVGIEALSRGAREVVFLDSVLPAIRTIEDNLRSTQLQRGADVVKTDAFAYVAREGYRPFDVVYIAPPQYEGLWIRALQLVDERPSVTLTPDGIVIVQIDPKESEEIALQNLSRYDRRKYGNTQLDFYEVAARG